MEIQLIQDLIIIFGLSVIVIYLFEKIKIPQIVGFLVTGAIVGPHFLGLISKHSNVDMLAEIGIILILFSVGIDFSLKKLLDNLRNFLVGGSLQFGLTVIAILFLFRYLGYEFNSALYIGFCIAITATAIMLKILDAHSALDTPHGKTSLTVSLFQDLATVAIFLVAPLLIGESADIGSDLLFMALKIIGIIIFMYISIKFIMPTLIYQIAKTRIKELFVIVILLICVIIVWLATLIGISVALGAFLAGLIISETDYSFEAHSFVEPFRDVFASFFFVSIGMMLNISFLTNNIVQILSLLLVIFVIKAVIMIIAALASGNTIRVATISSFLIFPLGEFNIVLAVFGLSIGLIDNHFYQLFLSITVLSIISAPFLYEIGLKIGGYLSKFSPANIPEVNLDEYNLNDHLVIIGYGVNGRNLARAAQATKLNYIIIEMNPQTVMQEKAKGELIIYGDATKQGILDTASISTSRICVIAISDATAVRMITYKVKQVNPNIYLIVRTRYIQEVDELYRLGADEVIPEEFETSVEIFTRVLTRYLIPRDEIKKFVNEIRSEGYKMLRGVYSKPQYSDLKHHIPDLEMASFRVKLHCTFIGYTLADLRLREKYNVTLLAIKRGDEILGNPGGDSKILEDDIIIVFGKHKDLVILEDLFNPVEE